MTRPDLPAHPRFSQPTQQLLTMIVILALVGVGSWIALPRIEHIITANPFLNGVILGVFAIGVLATFWQMALLVRAVRWLRSHVGAEGAEDAGGPPPALLAPLAALFREGNGGLHLSPVSARSVLDAVAMRIEEARDITRYIANVLIFLGLLGTFYGLAITVPAVVETIRSLSPTAGEDAATIFQRLMHGLENQLGGMGTAFSSSLLGLAGSLVIGLLELFATHGQNRFYRELEEWLTSMTSFHAEAGASGESGWLAEILLALSRQIDALADSLVQSDISRHEGNEKIAALAGAVEALGAELRAERQAREAAAEGETAALVKSLERISEGQRSLLDEIRRLAVDDTPDVETRRLLRSINTGILRLHEEMAAGRIESVAEIRAEIAALARKLAARGGGEVTLPLESPGEEAPQ